MSSERREKFKELRRKLNKRNDWRYEIDYQRDGDHFSVGYLYFINIKFISDEEIDRLLKEE